MIWVSAPGGMSPASTDAHGTGLALMNARQACIEQARLSSSPQHVVRRRLGDRDRGDEASAMRPCSQSRRKRADRRRVDKQLATMDEDGGQRQQAGRKP